MSATIEIHYDNWDIIESFEVWFYPLNEIFILVQGTVSCGVSLGYPDCSYCPLDNTTAEIRGCNGNCQFNSSTHLCEKKSMLSVHKIITCHLICLIPYL